MINAIIVADSISPQKHRLTTFELTFPRIILSELNTHRMFSRNTASSRAVPFEKMVETIKENPFIPIAWQKDHKGMQGTEYMTGEDANQSEILWIASKNEAIDTAIDLHNHGVTKQLCNRLLEPFMWTKTLLTTSEEGLNNFFELRCPKYEISLTPDDSEIAIGKSWKELMDWRGTNGIYAGDFDTKDYLERMSYNKSQAEIHIQALAESMYDAYNESNPKQLKSGEWHIPYEGIIDIRKLIKIQPYTNDGLNTYINMKIKVATALAARVSYTTIDDEKELDYEKLIKLHNRLIEMKHSSPLEHCGRVMTDDEISRFVKGHNASAVYTNENKEEDEPYEYTDAFGSDSHGWCNNFKGFIPYRYLIEYIF